MGDETGSRPDPEELVHSIQEGASVGRRVAAARPGWPEVGKVVADLCDAFVESVWGSGESARVDQRPLRPLPSAQGDVPGTPLVNPDNGFVLMVANTSVTAVRDHLLGFGNLCAGGGPGRTILAISRVLLDAAAHVMWLLDPAIHEELRLSRAGNMWLESVRQQLGDPISDEEKDRLRTIRDMFFTQAVADGLTRCVRRNGTPDDVLEPRFSHDDVIEAALGNRAQDPWRAASSVAHAQERPHLQFELGLGDIDPGPHATSFLILRSMFALTISIEAIRRTERFYGSVGKPVPEDLFRKVLFVGGLAGGMYDDLIRARQGLG